MDFAIGRSESASYCLNMRAWSPSFEASLTAGDGTLRTGSNVSDEAISRVGEGGGITDGGAESVDGDAIVADNPFADQTDDPLAADAGIVSFDSFKSSLAAAKGVDFVAGDQSKNADYILGADGKLRKNPEKKDPAQDGKLTIGVETDPKKSEKDALKAANDQQKAWAKEMINYWINSPDHKGEDIPQEWQDLLNTPLDLPGDATPASPPPTAAPTPADLPPPPSTGTSPSDAGRGGTGGGFNSGGGYGGGSDGGGYGGGFDRGSTYPSDGSGEVTGTRFAGSDKQTVLDNVRIVERVAKELGVDPVLAVATMLVESGGDNRAVGDEGTSFGFSNCTGAGNSGI